ncbi:uncharacterized protein A4U43_C03F26440 [Asparagus officinalis]|uniref:Pentacotripeptide-repeat region of PRORP domain-containing protein n=1 Tax=Asparagus officinalis TaxID=4686 RepID=A0A5P1FFZ3_ASPOF|nr:pentatricopeptide repeat-containing protein At3g49710-like [Asparagus officinalis]XP_020258032.1 pentatricopeptide repeat-containing protein At3g49710-like [Asparagus officinalis]XP_020258033.1 pentatricopeptide repeat-containing protein At3g49710-like [Asparagus officinalis]XP_020258034.1 pentatricopeptide repeat-containing protein At3g49710-like [Asparagus officinalis]XP_020258036.1 pentatricopeptide repeat-containing protein At3g49710-like [Asparagus officinalis]ONK76327.1 uncharacterize
MLQPQAQKLHASLLKLGHHGDVYRCNLILNSYINAGSLPIAHQFLSSIPSPNVVSFNTLLSGHFKYRQPHNALTLFVKMPQRDSRSYNIAISGLWKKQLHREAIELFIRMLRSPTRPDRFTYSSVILCCGSGIARQMHAQVIKVYGNSRDDMFVANNLVKMYCESGAVEDGRKVFSEMPVRDCASWNVMMSCYVKIGKGEFCLSLFIEMVRNGVGLDEFTLAIVLSEFANCLLIFGGLQVHCLIVKTGFCWDQFTCNALLNLYSKCGYNVLATKLFEEMPETDAVSWTALIMGLASSGLVNDAFDAFYWMRVSQVNPNSSTFGSLIGSCASANAIERGKQYHALAIKYNLELETVVGSAIVDMYSKSGAMNEAMKLFMSLPIRDLISWNGMICGLAHNGEATKALDIFDEMVRLHQGTVTPNNITFVGVLTACSHGGLVHRGFLYFNDMVHKYLIKPQAEHYACIIDLLARAGQLEQAETLIRSLPFEPDVVMLSALLGACRKHGDLVMAKRIAQQLATSEPKSSSSYVMLANMYSDEGEWIDAMDVREMMCETVASKVAASSWIETRGSTHSFASGHAHHT